MGASVRALSGIFLTFALSGCVEYSWFRPDAEPAAPLDTAVIADTAAPIANAPVYANTSDTLYEIEPGTGELRTVGSFWLASGELDGGIVDIAINTDGLMYGATTSTLYQIHPFTTEVWKICATDGAMMALTFTADGELVGGNDEGVHLIDMETCENDRIAGNNVYETSGDLVGLPDGYLYWTVRGENSDELVRVAPANGSMRWVGEIGYDQLFGVGYDNGVLYGFGYDGEIVSINPDTATTTMTAKANGYSWWGATTNPISW